jgi:alkylation response protein AidB-like acyl-CoA dehydrogenase
MEFEWSADDLAFRDELRAFLRDELPGRWTGATATLGSKENVAYSHRFAGLMAERGWLTPHWPTEHGGQAASAWQHTILGEELWSLGEPRGPQYMNVNWIGPSIMAHGTPEQQRLHLTLIARGEVIWCQGFSEPEAGTDLAALRTRAELAGDDYVVNGSKIWTSYADVADYCYLLVRTGAGTVGPNGISVLLVPTDTPGFEIRPVPAVVGDHSFNELFFADARVPVSCRLGPEDLGWTVVREALAYERVGAPRWARAAYMLEQAVQWAIARDRFDDPVTLETVGRARAMCEGARMLYYRVIDERDRGSGASPNPSLARVAMVQAERLVAEACLELMGPESVEYTSLADHQLRKSLSSGVAAGTYEVQLNLISRLHLRLPKG